MWQGPLRTIKSVWRDEWQEKGIKRNASFSIWGVALEKNKTLL